jgi:hypothetical protein
MFARYAMAAALASATMPITIQTATAFGDCRGHAECYQKVKAPDTYATVARPVVLQPARSETVHVPAVVTERMQRVEVQPGSWTAHHRPAEYGSVAKTVMVQPARVSHSTIPARYETRHETVVVRPASFRWERTVDRHGRETMCKVAVSAETRTVARQVQVSPAHTVAHTVPAVYKTVTQAVLVSPAKTVHTYNPPVHSWVANPMVLRHASTKVVTHPAVTAVVHEQVKVKDGAVSWQPVARRHW